MKQLGTVVIYLCCGAMLSMVFLIDRAVRRRQKTEDAIKEAAQAEKKFWDTMLQQNLENQGTLTLPNRTKTKSRESVN